MRLIEEGVEVRTSLYHNTAALLELTCVVVGRILLGRKEQASMPDRPIVTKDCTCLGISRGPKPVLKTHGADSAL